MSNSFGHQQDHFNSFGYPTAVSSYSSYSAYQPRRFASPVTVESYHAVPAVHIAKREAEGEAEAEPQMFYNSFGRQGLFNTAFNTYSYPTVYSGYPRGYYQPSNDNFGYRNFYAKREAEAEPMIYQTPYNTPFNTAFNTPLATPSELSTPDTGTSSIRPTSTTGNTTTESSHLPASQTKKLNRSDQNQ